MSQNQIPITFGAEWKTPTLDCAFFRFQYCLIGNVSLNIISIQTNSDFGISMGINSSSLNSSNRSIGVGEASIQRAITDSVSVQLQSAVSKIPDLISGQDSNGNSTTFSRGILNCFSLSGGFDIGEVSNIQLTLPSGDDLMDAFFANIEITLKIDKLSEYIFRRTPNNQQNSTLSLSGNLTTRVRIGLSVSGARFLGENLLRHLPGSVSNRVISAVTSAAIRGASTLENSALLEASGGVVGISITLGVEIMNGLNAVLSRIRSNGAARGICHSFANGYLERVYFEDNANRWNNSNRGFQRGVRAAERDIENNINVFVKIYNATAIYSWEICHFDRSIDSIRFVNGGEEKLEQAKRRFGEYLFSAIDTGW